MSRRECFTYFIQGITGGPIKIGKAVSPYERLALFQTGSPVELEIVGLLHGDYEREWHADYKWARLHGEWFINMPDLVEDINTHAIGGCAVAEDLNHLVMAHCASVESLREYMFIPREDIPQAYWDRRELLYKGIDPDAVMSN